MPITAASNKQPQEAIKDLLQLALMFEAAERNRSKELTEVQLATATQ